MEFKVWDPSTPDVTFETARVAFPAFTFYREQALEIAEYVRSVAVTEDNVKDVKKELAQVRKVTDELARRRIAIKREILTDFDVFEAEVKDLSEIISDAERELRAKVRELDEAERDRKEEQIRELWDKKAAFYQINQYIPNAFNVWLIPSYLNKSVSMKSIEREMTEWLETTEKEISTLKAMDDEYLVEYLGVLDMAKAINNVNERREIRETISEETEETDTATFIVTGEKDIKLAEVLLKSYEINYIRR